MYLRLFGDVECNIFFQNNLIQFCLQFLDEMEVHKWMPEPGS
jgi:hypothetical protein